MEAVHRNPFIVPFSATRHSIIDRLLMRAKCLQSSHSLQGSIHSKSFQESLFMNVKHVVALSVLAFVANVAWAEGSTYQYPQKTTSAKTRAEVRNEALNGRSAVQFLGDIAVAVPQAGGSPRSRDEVRAEARREARTHEVTSRLLP
jgi:hypothetical protein